MGAWHPLGHPRGAGRVENLGKRIVVRHEGLEWARVEKGRESFRSLLVESDRRHEFGNEILTWSIGERDFDAAVAEDVRDRLARQLVIDWYCNPTDAHDAEIACDKLGPILRQNTDPRARPHTSTQKSAADGLAQRIEFERGELL